LRKDVPNDRAVCSQHVLLEEHHRARSPVVVRRHNIVEPQHLGARPDQSGTVPQLGHVLLENWRHSFAKEPFRQLEPGHKRGSFLSPRFHCQSLLVPQRVQAASLALLALWRT
jgi:hypothetical protein